MAPSSGGYFLWMKIVNGMSKVGKRQGYLKERDPSHSINEHVIHVVNMIKCLEVEYIFLSSHKKRILQMSLTESEDKVLENMWEFVQEGSHGTLTNILREEYAIRRTTVHSISPNSRNVSFSNSIRHKNLRGLWLLKTTSRVIEDIVYNPSIAPFSFKGED
ncbi:hypothetical protein AAG906_026039 [Vitis piasezkii]